MDTVEHIKHLAHEGRLLADAAELAGSDAEVRTCPGWKVRHLLRHTGMVHRWATSFVAEGHTSYRPGGGEPDLDGAPLLDWYREGHERLVAALTGAPDDLECWSFLSAPSPLAFWARRQAHETTVHRVDAESALGLVAGRSPVEPALAADGIDELLCGFHGRDGSRVRADRPGVLRIRTTDTGDVWTAALSADAPRTTRTAEGPADCELTGPAEALYLSLWNRLPAGSPAVGVAGDDRLARLWRETSAVTW
ncbi:maleylpyruvate isomerase family mycothiol-dependent enzyme [Streptomyces somaliensis]|uniref:maleylpyruvate isomerase family mycothiol-dependent enzyme n=1 Tax=Streptomyces somaliensis TaxID=78355 RepID=UPI0020CEF531|nr:maleylpyruvate isomerase family mycothiol-dependent enzyme [Streptomyces somaliensis]MCP9946728.1 maleylpyruvate isomerase family mycothiol-dependent enzyme [Streptomyces somaliensis]MCP9963693.1 maleylpyruvate isomerase family mycothiol-dependent enzyme [Streptomyces somaliensis]MCP9972908.1 maleylpyruvate isomerase family mycothiol-dependent enzyme [Streptomyces somaliensis]